MITWRVPDVPIGQLEHILRTMERDPQQTAESLRLELESGSFFQLATCQRVLFAFTHGCPQAPEKAAAFFAARQDEDRPTAFEEPEIFTGAHAIRHLMEVASSLDALTPGERQVFSQFRTAVRQARQNGWLDDELERVLERVTQTARSVQAVVQDDKGRESLVPLTQETTARHLEGIERPCVAVAGTGVIAKALVKMVRSLRQDARLFIVSRDLERAKRLAQKIDATPVTLEAFLAHPPQELCLVGFAMRCDRPVAQEADLKRWAEHTNRLLVLDFGMPRNAEPPQAELPGLTMICLEGLSRLGQAERGKHTARLARADEILERHLERYLERERLEADRLQSLADRFERIAHERWRDLPVDPGGTGEEQRLHKWFDQTVRALRHEAIQTVKRLDRGGAS